MNTDKHLINIVNKIEHTIKDIDPGLKNMIEYQIYETGQSKINKINLEMNYHEISSSLNLISKDINDKNYSKIITGLSALFLFKSGIIVHDEIGSGTPNSNGRDTLWWKWGPAQAINAGDCLYSLSRLLIINDDKLEVSKTLDILKNFDNLNKNIFKSKFLELQDSEQYKIDFDTTENIYKLKEIESYNFISGLFDDDEDISKTLKLVGEINLYIMHEQAFKNLLSKDINYQYTKLENEILNKKKVLPIAYIFNTYKNELEYEKKLGTIYMKRMLEHEDIKFLHKTFYSTEVVKKYNKHINNLKNETNKIINNINQQENNLTINLDLLLQ
ncbi:MAG: hypothetical protein ACJZ9C_01320 [Dehalococcoidia bacterium]